MRCGYPTPLSPVPTHCCPARQSAPVWWESAGICTGASLFESAAWPLTRQRPMWQCELRFWGNPGRAQYSRPLWLYKAPGKADSLPKCCIVPRTYRPSIVYERKVQEDVLSVGNILHGTFDKSSPSDLLMPLFFRWGDKKSSKKITPRLPKNSGKSGAFAIMPIKNGGPTEASPLKVIWLLFYATHYMLSGTKSQLPWRQIHNWK